MPEPMVAIDGHTWELVDVGPCPDCKGTGILRGLQWGSSEWPGCEVCAPHMLVTGVESDLPDHWTHRFIGRRVALRRMEDPDA